MNYKKWLIDDLKNLRRDKFAVVQLTSELETIEAEYASIKATDYDKMPGGKGDNVQEQKLLDAIARKEEKAACLKATKLHVADMERLLGQLAADEKEIIERTFINEERCSHDVLAEELGCSVRTINYKKQDALDHLARLRFGAAYRP